MKIKKIVLMLVLVSGSVFANNNVKLDKVTLFLQGAELQGQSTVAIEKGENRILLTGVANGINPNSINVGFGNNSDVTILSTTLKNNYLLKNIESDELKSLRDKLKQLQTKYRSTEIQFDAVSETINVLKGNRLDGLVKNNNQMLNEMKSTLDFVKNNLVSALSEQNTLQIELDELSKQITEYQSQIEQERASSRDVSNVIVVNVYSDKNTTLPVTVSYVTTQAGWKPIYDVRVADINSPLQLTYKADVYQRSGLDWYNVDFSLSTSNPSEGITAPTLFPWQVNIYNEKTGYSFYSKNAKYSADDSIMYGVSEVSAEGKQSISRPAPPVENVLINTSGINTKFDVKLPYTIKSNSTNNVLTLQDKQVKAQYRYISTPKLDSNVFLQAQITDWDRLNLLPGKSTVFFNGNYIGESFLTTEGAKETLDLSLGRDKNILITRNRDVNETSKPSFFGNDVSQKYAYTIDVKNTKTLPIDITVYDQLPVIQNKAITLEDAKYDGATYDKETGLLTWTSLLSPSETKTFKLSFQLTYPKDKANSIIGL